MSADRRLQAAISVACALTLALPAAGCRDGAGAEPGTGSVPAIAAAGSSTPSKSEPAPTASCNPTDLLRALRGRIGTPVVQVEVVRCRNDFARVQALPDASVCPPNCYEAQEVYLRRVESSWRVLNFGTGIECEDTTTLPPLPRSVRRACRALGYHQPTILRALSFHTPSRNIGCSLAGEALRCDILSGLLPRPEGPCDREWTGLLLASEGPAEPNCASDTVYDRHSPTLSYGDLWHGPGFWCVSQPSGLLCFNPRKAGGSFLLSRAGWEG